MRTDTPTAGPALDLAWFGVGMVVALLLTPVRGLAYAVWRARNDLDARRFARLRVP